MLLIESFQNLDEVSNKEFRTDKLRSVQEAYEDYYVTTRNLQSELFDIRSRIHNKTKALEGIKEEEVQQIREIERDLKLKQKDRHEAESNLENAQRRLVSATAELDAIENKHLDATETRATQFPTLSIQKRLLFCITKVVWEINEDPSCSRLRGYVINPGKQDASVFNFETKNISKATSCRFLWDYIGASGISKKWKNL